ncbi:MAG: chlorhexidine efflux transporter, partial [Paracoccaceae bacterium]|nr:chlorhexidine efflux transporter [Paracoccaceae bacterium]
MRRTADRIRHAISFELIALAIITPLGAMVFDTPIREMGVVTVVSATIATGWNYLYNLMFDHAMLRRRGSVIKTP